MDQAGQIGNPTHPWCATHFDGRLQKPVQGQENWHLNQHRQTTTKRIDLLSFIELHHGLIELLRFVLYFSLSAVIFGVSTFIFAMLRKPAADKGTKRV